MKNPTLTMILAAMAPFGVNVTASAQTVQGSANGEARMSAQTERNGARVSNANQSNASANAHQANANATGESEMSATLTKAVDAKKAKPGDEVNARSDKDAKAADGTSIKRGSKLVGHVTQAHPKSSAGASGSGNSTLGIVFDKAVLKDGREVPLDSTIQAISVAQVDNAMQAGEAETAMSAAGSGAAMARGGSSGLLGGVAGSATGGLGAVGGLGHGAGGMLGTTVAGSGTLVTQSAGAIGGLNAAGDLASGSKGVFGFKDFNLSSTSQGSAEGSVISSASRNVRLDSGTKMLLSNSTNATAGAMSNSSGAAASSTNSAAARDAAPVARADRGDKNPSK